MAFVVVKVDGCYGYCAEVLAPTNAEIVDRCETQGGARRLTEAYTINDKLRHKNGTYWWDKAPTFIPNVTNVKV